MLRQKNLSYEKDLEPLKATIYDLSKTGNLTIMFSKPIIKPPIEIRNLNETYLRRLSYSESSFPKLVPVKEFVNITVESEFYENESEKIQIVGYVATRLTTNALDIQLDFKHPDLLTISKTEPDRLRVEFSYG